MKEKEAIDKVPAYVVPRDCFIMYMDNKRGYQVISGTPCAHYVAHQLDLKGDAKGASCNKGYLIRVQELLQKVNEVDLEDVQVNDVWSTSEHCGMVIAVDHDEKGKVTKITVRHDSSGQQKLAENDWATYLRKTGKFYRASQTAKTPKSQANEFRLKKGLPYSDFATA